MEKKAFQDYYPEDLSHCYGCGTLNEKGLHVQSFWDGDESVCIHTPRDYYTAIPGFVYGGLLASLIDCHCTGTASAAKYRAEGREMGSDPALRFVTASLHVDYLKPTPMGCPLEVRAKVTHIKGRRVVIEARLLANGQECVKGEVVAVQIPDTMKTGAAK